MSQVPITSIGIRVSTQRLGIWADRKDNTETLTEVTYPPEALSPAQGGVQHLCQEAQPQAGLSPQSQKPPGLESLFQWALLVPFRGTRGELAPLLSSSLLSTCGMPGLP